MPVIPTAISTQSIPGSTGMPQMSSADPIGAALEQSGQQLGRSANQVQHFLAVRDNLRKSNDAESMVFDFKDKTNLIAEAMKTDPTMNETKVKEQIDGIISQYQEKTDPDVWQYAQKHIIAESHALISTARAKDTNREIDRAKALTDRNIFEGVREAARPGNTPEQIMEIKGRMTGDILGKVQVGVFTSEQGQLIINHLDEQISTEYFTQLGQVDPTKALNELKNTDKGSMAYQLNPLKRDELIAHFGEKAKIEVEDAAYQEVFQAYKLGDENQADYLGAIKYLRDPNNLKSLTINQRRELENTLKAQQNYGEKVKTDAINKTYNSELDTIGELANQGKIGQALKILNNSQVIPGLDKWKMRKAFADAGTTKKSDVATYLDGVDKMYDPETPMEEKKTWLLSNRNKLSDSDIKHLGAVGFSQERRTDAAASKAGISILKSSLTFPGTKSATADERVRSAVDIYERGLKENADKLTTPDDKKTYAYQILKMPQFQNINPIADMKADMQKMRGVGIGQHTPTTTTPTANSKTVTIDGKQYKQGDIVEKDGKKFRVNIQ